MLRRVPRGPDVKTTHRFTYKPTGEELEVELEINVEEVARALAARAYHTKNCKASTMGGDIRATVRKGLAGLPAIGAAS